MPTYVTSTPRVAEPVFSLAMAFPEYRGPPDPLRGDAPYKKVRDAAKVWRDVAVWVFSTG